MQVITIDYLNYTITSDKSLMLLGDIHHWLSTESYWCNGIPFDIFERSFEHSFCIGALQDGKQIAFARLITDYATFGYLADVFVTADHRGKGISKKMLQILFNLEWVKGMRCLRLATKGTHGLYKQFGFTACSFPDRIMELIRPDIYKLPPTKS